MEDSQAHSRRLLVQNRGCVGDSRLPSLVGLEVDLPQGFTDIDFSWQFLEQQLNRSSQQNKSELCSMNDHKHRKTLTEGKEEMLYNPILW